MCVCAAGIAFHWPEIWTIPPPTPPPQGKSSFKVNQSLYKQDIHKKNIQIYWQKSP